METTKLLKNCYTTILRLSNTPSRVSLGEIQSLLCDLRDSLAERLDKTPQEVQDEAESIIIARNNFGSWWENNFS